MMEDSHIKDTSWNVPNVHDAKIYNFAGMYDTF